MTCLLHAEALSSWREVTGSVAGRGNTREGGMNDVVLRVRSNWAVTCPDWVAKKGSLIFFY